MNAASDVFPMLYSAATPPNSSSTHAPLIFRRKQRCFLGETSKEVAAQVRKQSATTHGRERETAESHRSNDSSRIPTEQRCLRIPLLGAYHRGPSEPDAQGIAEGRRSCRKTNVYSKN